MQTADLLTYGQSLITANHELAVQASTQPPSEAGSDWVDHLLRHETGRVTAALTREFGPRHFDMVEDAVQDALVKALRHALYHGAPVKPGAWLYRVARNRALDLSRADKRLNERHEAAVNAEHPAYGDPALLLDRFESGVDDDTLRMIFLCCHPALPREARIALTLKTVGGFAVSEIAAAFITNEPAVAQRLVRAKRTLRARGISFAGPSASELSERIESVLDVLYLMFNEGYSAHGGEAHVRADLCDESIRLAGILTRHEAGNRPEAHALLALMRFHMSRLPARIDANGQIVLLEDQDRSLWDRAQTDEGIRELRLAESGERLTRYHLEAGIACIHAMAPDFASTDWKQILWYYDALREIAPSAVVALNRAVAIAELSGPKAGLEAMPDLTGKPELAGYYLYHATEGELHRRCGKTDEAAAAYARALECAVTTPERSFLVRRLNGLRTDGAVAA